MGAVCVYGGLMGWNGSNLTIIETLNLPEHKALWMKRGKNPKQTNESLFLSLSHLNFINSLCAIQYDEMLHTKTVKIKKGCYLLFFFWWIWGCECTVVSRQLNAKSSQWMGKKEQEWKRKWVRKRKWLDWILSCLLYQISFLKKLKLLSSFVQIHIVYFFYMGCFPGNCADWVICILFLFIYFLLPVPINGHCSSEASKRTQKNVYTILNVWLM